jgi:ATP-dependent DNA helicase
MCAGPVNRRGARPIRHLLPHRRAASGAKEVLAARPWQIQIRRKEPSAQDVMVPLIRELVNKGQKILVFRNMLPKTEGCANYLAQDLGLPAAQEALEQLPAFDASTSSAALRRALAGGTAFHNTNLSREERNVVERAYRDPRSPLRVLVATTTVAAGINTPASTVIIAEQEFVGEDGRPFTVAEYKNMAGRAGRLGFNEEGTSIILAETPADTANLLRRYVQGTLESLHSSFDLNALDTWLIRLLAQVRKVPRAEVSRLLANTYSGYLAALNNPDWRHNMTLQLEALLSRMLTLGLAEQDGEDVQLTLLGRACGRSPLSLPSALRLIEILRSVNVEILQPLTLVAFVQVLPESDSGYTPMFKRGQKESARVREAAQRYGGDAVRHLQQRAADIFDYWARCKRAINKFTDNVQKRCANREQLCLRQRRLEEYPTARREQFSERQRQLKAADDHRSECQACIDESLDALTKKIDELIRKRPPQ